MGKHDPKLFFTPLSLAVWYGNTEEVESLIVKGHSVDEALKQCDGSSCDQSPTLNIVFDAGELKFHLRPTRTGAGPVNITPLMVAAIKDNLEIVKLLVENGASRFQEDITSKTALSYAAMSGGFKCVKYLLNGFKNAYASEFAAINCATMCGNLEAVKLLVDQAFDSNLKPGSRLSGAFALAQLHKQDQVATYLAHRMIPERIC